METRKRAKGKVEDKPTKPTKKTRYSVEINQNKTATTGCKDINKGNKVPVDAECLRSVENVHVYSSGEDIYNVTLSQTNINRNNNKYYIIQLLEDDDGEIYRLWTRWGRIGAPGSNKLFEFGSNLERAIKDFCDKFFAKTKNKWEERKNFVKVDGKYSIVDVSHEEPTKTTVQKQPEPVESKIPEKIQNLMRLISNVKEMEDIAKSLKYDAGKGPLGELTEKQITNGLTSLKKINNLIEANDFSDELVKLCDIYYTQIPHNFGMRKPPIIRSTLELKAELDLLETLGGIELAFRILKGSVAKSSMHPIDATYHSLKCGLQSIEREDPNFKVIEDYLLNTHGRTHQGYTMEVDEVFSIDRSGEKEKFLDVGNKMLLWHGTRLTNIVGILGQGLRIAPPEAPVTGYMFGKGVYFADISSKSANYCHTTKKNNVGFLILCQVSLGNLRELIEADYNADKLPKDMNSVKGMGMVQPNKEKNHLWEEDTMIPAGEPKKKKVPTATLR